MSENIEEKTTKAFKVDLDSRANQNIILKLSARYFNNQAHQVNEVAKKKLTNSLKTPHILTMTSF
ncbi:hypothetical protein BD0135_13880 [Helicobacter pylori]